MSNQPSVLCSSMQTREPLSVAEAVELAGVFKALGDPVRLRLLSLIAAHQGGEACVCDLTGAFELSGPTISHHLKVLREAGLVTSQRRGTWVYYRAAAARIELLSTVLVPGRDLDTSVDTVPASTCCAEADTAIGSDVPA